MLAIWFCYWIAAFYPAFHARPSRIACIAVPILLSALLVAFPAVVLNPLGDFLTRAPLAGISRFDVRGESAIAISIAVILSTFTLLIAALIGQILSLRPVPSQK